jgi:NADPH-dependent 2,4-dienoyl-CoA reductase/sulfur reductase-like enzyme
MEFSPAAALIDDAHTQSVPLAIMPELALDPLRVSIVGAGLGGLAAAVSLRRQGHQVQVRARTFMIKRSQAL